MRFTQETRRPLTGEEKGRGIEWLEATGYELQTYCSGKLAIYQKRQDAFWIVVIKPQAIWSVHVYEASKELASSFGEFSECREAVEAVLEQAGQERLLRAMFGWMNE